MSVVVRQIDVISSFQIFEFSKFSKLNFMFQYFRNAVRNEGNTHLCLL